MKEDKNSFLDFSRTYRYGLNETVNSKLVTSNFYIKSFHEFSNRNLEEVINLANFDASPKVVQDEHIGDYGYDWFFIKQECILDGSPQYEKRWERWTCLGKNVLAGDVILNYVGKYEMKSVIENSRLYSVELIKASPQASNDTEVLTTGIDFNLGSTIGFELGKENKLTGAFSTGVNFSESRTIEIKDCRVQSNSNVQQVKWIYEFKKARQNTASCHWQELFEPALLSHSTFCPVNMWIWRVPTVYRDKVVDFLTSIDVELMNTVSRNSGSKSPDHVSGGMKKVEKRFKLPYPPLISTEEDDLIYDFEGGSRKLLIYFEGTQIDINDEEFPSWLRVEVLSSKSGVVELLITVDECEKDEERTHTIVLRGNVNSKFIKSPSANEIKILVKQVRKKNED